MVVVVQGDPYSGDVQVGLGDPSAEADLDDPMTKAVHEQTLEDVDQDVLLVEVVQVGPLVGVVQGDPLMEAVREGLLVEVVLASSCSGQPPRAADVLPCLAEEGQVSERKLLVVASWRKAERPSIPQLVEEPLEEQQCRAAREVR